MPDHLWIYVFLCGYKPEGHRPGHLCALGLAPTVSGRGLSNSSPPEGWEVTASGLFTLVLFRLMALHHWRLQCYMASLLGGGTTYQVRITKGCSPGHMVHSLLDSSGGGRDDPLWVITKGQGKLQGTLSRHTINT